MRPQLFALSTSHRHQRWVIAVGEHAGHLEREEAQRCEITVWLAGPARGQIEISDERSKSRTLNAAQAEALAARYDHESDPGEQRIEAALLDAAHLARVAMGASTSRRKPGRL